MTTITFQVAERIATITTDDPIVAGNTYPMDLTLDSEWSGTAYVRVRFGSQHYDIPVSISGGAATAQVQLPLGFPEIGVGLYSDDQEQCTNEVRLRIERSILDSNTEPVVFDDDLYDQWVGEVTDLLVDDHLDASSGRPIANSVVAALDSEVVKKDVTALQTITGPLALEKVADGRGSVVFGSYNGNVSSGRYLRIASFARPAGDHSHVKVRLLKRDAPQWIDVDLSLDSSGSEITGLASATCNFATRNEVVLAYSDSNDFYAVYVNTAASTPYNVVSVLVEAVNQAGEAIPLRPSQGMAVSSNISSMRELSRGLPLDVGYNLRMTTVSNAQATYPVWNLLATATPGGSNNSGIAGVFLLSTTNPEFTPLFGILHVSQRTGSTPDLRAAWMCCSSSVQSEDIALVQREGRVELWGKQRTRYVSWVATVMTSWRNSNNTGGVWTLEDADESQADLPSGEGVYSVYSTLPNGSQANMASLAMGLAVQPMNGGDGEDER